MRFRITYSGGLKAGGKKTRADEKEAVRRYISPQLAELRERHPVFRGYGLAYTPPRGRSDAPLAVGYGAGDLVFFAPRPVVGSPQPRRVDVAPGQHDIRADLNAPIFVDDRPYIPLVRNSFALTCGLDILFLRKVGEGPLIAEGGDLDNRIKTLFDGLRVPKRGEVPRPSSGEEATSPAFCLLEDDSLITDFAVRTDRLLTHPGAKESEVLLVIDVSVTVSHLTSHNLGFLSE